MGNTTKETSLADFMDIEQKKVEVYSKMEKIRDASSCSAKKLEYNVDGKEFYIMVISDNHNNTPALFDSLKNASYFENMGVVLLGDQGKISIPNSKTPSFEAKPVQAEIDATKFAIKESGIDTKSQILAYLDGNHEDRVKDHSSIEIGKNITSSFGISNRYSGHSALLTLNFTDPITQKPIRVKGFLNHGQGRGGGPGAEADKSLNSKLIKGADFVIHGDTHKIINANKTFEGYVPGKNKKFYKKTMFANFGTDLSLEDYLLKKNLPLRAVRDGEILKISIVPNKAGTASEAVLDFVNMRQVLNKDAINSLKKTKLMLDEVEKTDFKSISELKKTYSELASVIKEKFAPVEKINDKPVRIVELAGLNIGDENPEMIKKLDEIVDIVQKLDNCYVIINGNAIHYKKANLLHKINFPEDTFAYLQTLAQKLEPIKNKIIAYNSGDNEYQIMKTEGNAGNHARDLADIAMKNIQLDKELAFEKISKSKLNIEKNKIRNDQVAKYNESVLKREYNIFAYDNDKLIELARYKKKCIEGKYSSLTEKEKEEALAWKSEEIEYILVQKLRKEKKLLDSSTSWGRKEIDKRFPLSKIMLEQPNHNLVQNILCKMLDISPKSISINSDKKSTCDNSISIINGNGKEQKLNIVTSHKTGVKTRGATEKTLVKNHNGADVYVSDGEEYFTKEREMIVDENGNEKVYDILHISSGNLSDPQSSPRIYEIRSEKASRKRVEKGLYEDTDNLTLTCSSRSPQTILLDNTITKKSKLLAKMLKDSFNRKYDELMQRKVETEKETSKSKFEEILCERGA